MPGGTESHETPRPDFSFDAPMLAAKPIEAKRRRDGIGASPGARPSVVVHCIPCVPVSVVAAGWGRVLRLAMFPPLAAGESSHRRVPTHSARANQRSSARLQLQPVSVQWTQYKQL